MYFTIDAENNITVHASMEAATAETREFTEPPSDGFGSEKAFGSLAESWPIARLVQIWNGMAGEQKVLKFQSKDVAVKRIWKAIQRLNAGAETADVPATPKVSSKEANARHEAAVARSRAGKQPSTKAKRTPKEKKVKKERSAKPAKAAGGSSKKDRVVELLKAPGGATLADIMKKMDWQAHTVRGFMAGAMKKAGHTVESFKTDAGDRAYKIAS